MTFHPVLIALAIIAAVGAIGYVIAYVQRSATMRGYEELAPDVQAIAKVMKAESFRDGTDLVLNGNYGKFPAIVRFSYSDNTPGLNVRMKAPATFTLSVVPKGAKTTEGKVQLRTTEEMFDARFVTRTDHPTQARLFLSGKQAMASLQKLCCSSKTFFTVITGGLELSELVIPSPYTAKHVSDHLDAMSKIAHMLASMPGADVVKITPYKGERNLVLRAAMAVLVITGVLVMVSAVREHNAQQVAAAAPDAKDDQRPAGVSAADFQRMPGILGWRVARSDDFDSNAASWLGGQHRGEISGHIAGAFAGEGHPLESAYVFILEHGVQIGERRVIILANDQVLFDAAYKSVAIAARVSKNNFNGIEWQNAATPAPPDGDGLLIVRDANDPKSGLILYASGGKLATAMPTNYQSVTAE